ncbi:M23 family metallopeptidase [Oceaniglobus ichthyenteri]|uniref:M23 family metallopeptidase n=1 Tax=Oceaniglobus ichthyenteri TaxID=2136177 RepID=UPI001F0CAC66|nr:M23 family metallopeptidase [Oceaniglobus ichthyenteri]
MRLIIALPMILLAAPAAARDPILALPIDCTLGKTCFIQQYTDADPGQGAADYTCGPLSYDGHKGTDFALPFISTIDADIAVFAAAPGTVISVRDGMPDHLQGTPGAPDVSDRECGNGVVVGHGGGWQTQYCHLKRGSVTVRKGQRVSNATTLGHVGLSGQTQFPHLHLSVRHEGRVVDPFNATGNIACGQSPETSLWQNTPPYQPGGIISVGFSDVIPDYDTVKAGMAGAAFLPPDTPALVLWAFAYGSQPDDGMRLTITGPGGNILSEDLTIDRAQAQFFRAVGRRTTTPWPAGDYRGIAELTRGGETVDQTDIVVTIRP